MNETGEILRKRREELKISVAEVSIATKITIRMIHAIENNDTSHLPARTFLRGLIKSYALFLKLDPAMVLQTLEPANPEPTPLPAEASVVATETAAANENQTDADRILSEKLSPMAKASIGFGIVILLSAIFFTYKVVQKYEKEAIVVPPPTTLNKIETAAEESEPAEISPDATEGETNTTPDGATNSAPAATATSTTIPAPTVTAATVDAAKADPAKAPVAKPEPPKIEAPKVEVKTAETAKPTPKPEPAKVEAPKTEAPKAETPKPVTAKPAEAPKPAEATKPAETTKPPEVAKPTNKKSNEVLVEALDKVVVSFKIGTNEIKKITLEPGQVHAIKAQDAIFLEMSDGGAVNIVHNGQDLGVPGDLGKAKTLQIP